MWIRFEIRDSGPGARASVPDSRPEAVRKEPEALTPSRGPTNETAIAAQNPVPQTRRPAAADSATAADSLQA